MSEARATASIQASLCFLQAPVDDGSGDLVASQDLGPDVLFLALGLVLLLDGGGFPEAREVGPHLLGHLGEGLGLERGEVAEDRLDRFEPIDLGRAVACGERLCDQLLVELLDWQLAEPGDPGGQLLEVALLLGAG